MTCTRVQVNMHRCACLLASLSIFDALQDVALGAQIGLDTAAACAAVLHAHAPRADGGQQQELSAAQRGLRAVQSCLQALMVASSATFVGVEASR